MRSGSLSGYAFKLDYYVEGWNTHEDASALLGYCCWALLRKAKRQGMGGHAAWKWCRDFCVDETGVDLFESSPNLMLAWNNEGPLIEEFGRVG